MKFIRNIKLKRILQILLFATLPNLDLRRCVGDGDEMMFTVHGIGLVVAGIIFLHYGFKAFFKVYNLAWVAFGALSMWVITTAYHELPLAHYYKYYSAWIPSLLFLASPYRFRNAYRGTLDHFSFYIFHTI